MPQNNDIYAIVGRIKNILAKNDISLSPVGTILVNTYALVLKDLYDFAESLPDPLKSNLADLLLKKEGLPEYVIRLSTPKQEETLYEQFTREKPQFGSNEEALKHFTKEYDNLGKEYGVTGDEFWLEAENSPFLSEDHHKIMKLSRSIQMCRYLIEKEKNGRS